MTNQYYPKFIEFMIDRPLSQLEESIRCAELDILWDTLTAKEQSEIEAVVYSVPSAPLSLDMVDCAVGTGDRILPRTNVGRDR